MEIVSSILAAVGGVSGLITFVVLLAVAWLSVTFARSLSGSNEPMTERIVSLAYYAIAAVRKISDNGEYEGLSDEERHAAKKEQALMIIEEGLRAQGVTPNQALMGFASFAIEAALDRSRDMRTPVEEPTLVSDEVSEVVA